MAVRQPDPPILRELVGVETPGIDALRPQVQPLDTLIGQVAERRLRGAEVDGGPVVQSPRVPARGAVEEPKPVEAGVGGNVRVVGGNQWDAQPAGVVRSSPTEDERVDGVDHLGPEAAQSVAHARVYGSELYLGIGWERHAGDAVDRNALVRTRSFSVLGGDHEHLVAHPEQLFYGVPEPRDHAIGGRKEGLGKERDAHRVALASRVRTLTLPRRIFARRILLRTPHYQPPIFARTRRILQVRDDGLRELSGPGAASEVLRTRFGALQGRFDPRLHPVGLLAIVEVDEHVLG